MRIALYPVLLALLISLSYSDAFSQEQFRNDRHIICLQINEKPWWVFADARLTVYKKEQQQDGTFNYIDVWKRQLTKVTGAEIWLSEDAEGLWINVDKSGAIDRKRNNVQSREIDIASDMKISAPVRMFDDDGTIAIIGASDARNGYASKTGLIGRLFNPTPADGEERFPRIYLNFDDKSEKSGVLSISTPLKKDMTYIETSDPARDFGVRAFGCREEY